MSVHVEVAAGILLRRRDGASECTSECTNEFLLAQRPPGKVYAGYWEFPGGKVEAGETAQQALARELHEELGIAVERVWPWLHREFVYPHAHVHLKFFRVAGWHGDIAPIEHTGFAWLTAGSPPPVEPILPANAPILRALELPPIYALTNAAENGIEAELARLENALAGGLRLIQVRDKTLGDNDRLRLAEKTMALAGRHAGARVLINDDEALARRVGAHGVHLSTARLLRATRRPEFAWVGASCHSADELAKAGALGADFAVLGPLLPTPTHPAASGMGWPAFAQTLARVDIPVFALGGMRPEMLEIALENGAQGVALLRGWR